MREQRQMLIATTNEGKRREVLHVLQDLPFSFLTLEDVPEAIPEPEETGATLEENAMLKARAYAAHSGLLTIADDAGLFIDALDGWPGVRSARVATDTDARITMVLERMKGLAQRRASWRISICVFDPERGDTYLTGGEVKGVIREAPAAGTNGFGYDAIFVPDGGEKTFADMPMAEKSAISHRGKALFQMKYILQNQYGGKHLVVPVAIIVKDGLVLMAKRNDPHRPAFHGKWEFPGGRMDIGETLEENLLREVGEEVGAAVEIVERFDHITVVHQEGTGWGYQVYLLPYACRWTGERGAGSDAEVMETRWFQPEAVLREELLGPNVDLYKTILPRLQKLIAHHRL